MKAFGCLWNGETWATSGGKEKIDWSFAPFKANVQGFSIAGCQADGNINPKVCASATYSWNNKKYSSLSANDQKALNNVRAKYMNYDYCSDRKKYPVPAIECGWNQ
ncbi:unnamed protein product [Microthlaspi erraticum]|uniref:Xyloglucan endo-transglycosylase C-terminal domain-containing protein n=1 Tax=Microthlaspi erraticum TaxID=1685480 RepID=A0A6D2IBG9_9BRAS|nr:unnamed protein product [Microthlaspi erraticum]